MNHWFGYSISFAFQCDVMTFPYINDVAIFIFLYGVSFLTSRLSIFWSCKNVICCYQFCAWEIIIEIWNSLRYSMNYSIVQFTCFDVSNWRRWAKCWWYKSNGWRYQNFQCMNNLQWFFIIWPFDLTSIFTWKWIQKSF